MKLKNFLPFFICLFLLQKSNSQEISSTKGNEVLRVGLLAPTSMEKNMHLLLVFLPT